MVLLIVLVLVMNQYYDVMRHGFYPRTFFCFPNKGTPCAEARQICDNDQICNNEEDEQACKNDKLFGVLTWNGLCTGNYESDGSDVVKVLCRHFSYTFVSIRLYFTLDQWPNLIKRHLKQETTLLHQSEKQIIQSYQPKGEQTDFKSRNHRNHEISLFSLVSPSPSHPTLTLSPHPHPHMCSCYSLSSDRSFLCVCFFLFSFSCC
jgi:hypothetical protein